MHIPWQPRPLSFNDSPEHDDNVDRMQRDFFHHFYTAGGLGEVMVILQQRTYCMQKETEFFAFQQNVFAWRKYYPCLVLK
jgi:hypothetical protein